MVDFAHQPLTAEQTSSPCSAHSRGPAPGTLLKANFSDPSVFGSSSEQSQARNSQILSLPLPAFGFKLAVRSNSADPRTAHDLRCVLLSQHKTSLASSFVHEELGMLQSAFVPLTVTEAKQLGTLRDELQLVLARVHVQQGNRFKHTHQLRGKPRHKSPRHRRV